MILILLSERNKYTTVLNRNLYPFSCMHITEKILNEWKKLKSPGDTKTIANQLGVSTELVNRAFRSGKTSDRVFAGMAKFYKKKKALLRKLVSG